MPSDDLSSSPAESSAAPTREASLTVAANGRILDANAVATRWWKETPGEPLVGRHFVSLFYFEAPEGKPGSDPLMESWKLLLAAASAGALTLQARVPDGGFEAEVNILATDLGDASNDTYFATITQTGEEDSPLHLESLPAAEDEDIEPEADAEPAESKAETETEKKPSATAGRKESVPTSRAESTTARPERAAEAEDETDDIASDSDLSLDDLAPTSDLDDSDEDEDSDSTRLDEGSLTAELDALLPEPDDAPAAAPSAAAAEGALPSIPGSRIGFFELDLLTGSARFSDTWKSLLGYEPDEIADEADSLTHLLHPDDSDAAPQYIEPQRGTTTGSYSAEVRLRAKDESWRWMQLEGACTFDSEGTPVRVTGLMLDAQERREADEEAARIEARFNRLTARGRAAFFEIDLAADTAWYSPEFRRSLGMKAEDLGVTPDGFLKTLPPEDAEAGLPAFFQSVTASQSGLVTRYQLQHSDGRTIDIEAYLAVQRNKLGVIERVTGLQAAAGRDASPGTQDAAPDDGSSSAPIAGGMADALQQALNTAAEAIVVIDPQGRIMHVNARAAILAREAPAKLTTRHFDEVFTLLDRVTGATIPDIVRRVLLGGQPLDLDQSYSVAGPNGPELVALTCRPIFDNRRQITGATVVFRSSAEMPLTPAELVKSNRMEALGRLACGIVHDFNNLLTTVVGGISLSMDKRDLQPLETAMKACTNAKNLARQLLTFARGDVAGRRVQSLNDVIRETARMAGAGSKTSVELELSEDLYPVNVVTSQVVQVFTNLILNAMQVMPTGGRIWVRTLNMPLGQVNSVNLPPGDYVRADVQDNGPGIPQENLNRIFEPFFTTRAEGTGLGLAMVNSIVAQHGGAIEAASTVGSGTTFTLYFPRALTEAPKEEAARPIAVTHGTGRVLVMDDDADLCMIAQGMLEMLGYEAETAATAADAISMFRKARELNRRYSAVILDLTMSGGPGGEDVLARFREIDPGVTAIVSSGYATDDNAAHYEKLGFKGILSKPYRSADLGRVLKEVLGTKK